MKKCTFCGNDNFDTATVCERCKGPLPLPVFYNAPQAAHTPVYMPRRPSGLTTATQVIMIINTVLYSLMLFFTVGCWFFSLIMANTNLPGTSEFGAVAFIYLICTVACTYWFTLHLCMTRSYISKVKKGEPISMTFKVCSLIFLNVLTGVLMLCNNEN